MDCRGTPTAANSGSACAAAGTPETCWSKGGEGLVDAGEPDDGVDCCAWRCAAVASCCCCCGSAWCSCCCCCCCCCGGEPPGLFSSSGVTLLDSAGGDMTAGSGDGGVIASVRSDANGTVCDHIPIGTRVVCKEAHEKHGAARVHGTHAIRVKQTQQVWHAASQHTTQGSASTSGGNNTAGNNAPSHTCGSPTRERDQPAQWLTRACTHARSTFTHSFTHARS